MKIYDISQEVFSSVVFKGDRAPSRLIDKSIKNGDLYNLTSITMCTHNGTHIDAPSHFLEDGDTVDCIPLQKTVGYCYVSTAETAVTVDKALEILENARLGNLNAYCRILIKGNGVVTTEAAEVFANAGIYLLGVESQTVGDPSAPMATHLILLNKQVVLLEGLILDEVREGVYFLCAQPLNLEGSDGSPCRAILIKEQ